MTSWASSIWGVVTTEASYLAEDLGNAAKGTGLFGGAEFPWEVYLNTPELKKALEDKVTKQIKMLSKQPGIFLKLADGEKGIMEGFHFSWDEWDKIFIDNCLEFDPEIEVVGTPIIPSKISEEDFWKNYASHIHVICKTLLLDYEQTRPIQREEQSQQPQQPPQQQPPQQKEKQKRKQPQQKQEQQKGEPQQQKKERGEGRARGRGKAGRGRGRGRGGERRGRGEEKKKQTPPVGRKVEGRKGKGENGGLHWDPEEIEVHDTEEEREQKRREMEERERMERMERAERAERERVERQRVERVEREGVERERERVKAEKLQARKEKRERMERAKREREKARKEEKERHEKEQLERERQEIEREKEKEREEREKEREGEREREEREKEKRENEKREKEERERQEKEREEKEKEMEEEEAEEQEEGGWMGGWMSGWGGGQEEEEEEEEEGEEGKEGKEEVETKVRGDGRREEGKQMGGIQGPLPNGKIQIEAQFDLNMKNEDLFKLISQFEDEILKELPEDGSFDPSKLNKEGFEEIEREMEAILGLVK